MHTESTSYSIQQISTCVHHCVNCVMFNQPMLHEKYLWLFVLTNSLVFTAWLHPP